MSIQEMQKFAAISKYACYLENKGRKEVWEETVERWAGGFITKYPAQESLIRDISENYILPMAVFPSMRSLQFGGPALHRHNSRVFNCCSSYADRPSFFGQAMYLLLSGSGVGYSVQDRHLKHMPDFSSLRQSGRVLPVRKYVIEDSITGWAKAVHVQVSSYLSRPVPGYERYMDCEIEFDYSLISPAGTPLSYGVGKCPGPDSLKNSLDTARHLLDHALLVGHKRMNDEIASDYVLILSDAVVSGGIRRSALIGMFDHFSPTIMSYKTGSWFNTHPYRARANISSPLLRSSTSFYEFNKLFKATKEFGEPGFYWTDSLDEVPNPCVAGDTLISTTEGLKTVKSLVGTPFTAMVDGKPYKSSEKGFWKTGHKELIEMIFKSGRVLKVTPDHLIMTKDGWKKAGDITKDDEVVLNDNSEAGVFPRYFFSFQHKTIQSAREEQAMMSHCGILAKIIVNDDYYVLQPSYDKTDTLVGKFSLPAEDVFDATIEEVHAFSANGVYVHNCVEIGLIPKILVPKDADYLQRLLKSYDGPLISEGNSYWLSGIQGCNLSTINGRTTESKEEFIRRARVASQIGTLQAGFTKFPFLGEISERIFQREALIGVSICGMMHNESLFLNAGTLREGAAAVIEANKDLAASIGINQAARTTCEKPDGNSATVLQSFSGAHPGKIRKGFRVVQASKDDAVYKHFKENNPLACELSYWNKMKKDDCIRFPVTYEGTLESDMTAIEFLEKIRIVQNNWVTPGSIPELSVIPTTRHNVSCTVQVRPEEWDEVSKHIYRNRSDYGGVSLISTSGDKDYCQAPFTAVYEYEELINKYGAEPVIVAKAAIEAHKYQSGFFDSINLWGVCDYALGLNKSRPYDDPSSIILGAIVILKERYAFDTRQTTYLLKDVFNKLWYNELLEHFVSVDYSTMRAENDVKLIDEVACAGGACER